MYTYIYIYVCVCMCVLYPWKRPWTPRTTLSNDNSRSRRRAFGRIGSGGYLCTGSSLRRSEGDGGAMTIGGSMKGQPTGKPIIFANKYRGWLQNIHHRTLKYLYIYIYVYIYMCSCMSAFMYIKISLTQNFTTKIHTSMRTMHASRLVGLFRLTVETSTRCLDGSTRGYDPVISCITTLKEAASKWVNMCFR